MGQKAEYTQFSDCAIALIETTTVVHHHALLG